MRTDYELILQVASTGQELKREVCPRNKKGTPLTAAQWQRYWETRLLRYKRTPQHLKDAIRQDDLIVGWSNFDTLKRKGMTHDETVEILDHLNL